MPIPNAVLREDEELNALIQEVQAAESAPAEGTAQDAQEGVQDAQGEQQAAEEGGYTTPQEGELTGDSTASDGGLRAEFERLSHKFSVLQGKYNSETRQLREALRQRDAQIESLKTTPPPVQRSESQPIEYGIPEEEYDEDVVRLAERVADVKTQKAMESFEARMAEMRQQVTARQETDFYTDLAKIIPDWETIDQSEPWQRWLDGYDRRTGQQYQTLLEDAVRSRDAVRTAAFFEDFFSEQQHAAPANRPSVSSQVVPRSGPSTPVTPKQTISLAEWEAKADALSKGRMSAAAFTKLEAELDAAMKEGRVVV